MAVADDSGELLVLRRKPRITGWLSLFHADWPAWGLDTLSLRWIATGHTIGAFLMLAFLISHLYLATTGPRITSQVKAMVTGWEDLA